MVAGPAFLFDLDGTLVDSVYQHVLAWQDALDQTGIELAVWRIHRKIGMSGGLFANALLRETGRAVTPEEANRLRALHGEAYASRADRVRPLPGARELLEHLTRLEVPWAIATSGYIESAGPTMEGLGIPATTPVITRDQVTHAKPDPDLFLAAAAGSPDDALAELAVAGQAITVEARTLAHPVSYELASSVKGEGIEDRATMAPLSARRLADMIALSARVVAIELVVAAQAIDLRAPGQLGLGTGRAYRMIRELVPFTQADGTLPADLEPLVELVTMGTLTPAA